MFSLDKLAKDPAVKAAAKKAGLSTAKLQVEVLWADTSHGFEEKSLGTLAMELRLKDGSGKSKKQTFSTYLEGTMKKGLGGLSVDKLEVGLDRSWGWFYPPSAEVGGQKNTKSSRFETSTHKSDTGVGESAGSIVPQPHLGGSEASGYTPTNTHLDIGGGE